MLHRSPLPDITLPADTVYGTVFGPSAHPERPAITELDTGRSVTYAQLQLLIDAAVARLSARGIGPGSVVELRQPNSIDFAVGFIAISATGAAACLIGPTLIDAEARHLARLAGVTDTVRAADLAAPAGETEPHPELPPVSPDAVAAIPFSSGTTGHQKGVVLTHRSITTNAAQFNAALAASGIDGDIPVAAPLPFSHIYGLNTLLLSSLAAGRHVYTAARFDLPQFVEAHRAHDIELTFIAPPIAIALANHPSVDPEAFTASKHMVCGAAPLDEELARTVERRLTTTILQGYGTTESSPVTHVGIAGKSRPGSIGFAVPNTEFRVVDLDTGEEVEDGERGELQVRGPQLMRGYLRNEEATARALHGGWLRTGDIARVAEDGTVYIVDRAKDVIKYHGFQVAPAELEALLLTHPDIDDAAVAAYTRGEGYGKEDVPRAFVVKRNGSNLDAETIMHWVAARVTPYKKVREVTFVEEIPRNAAGKILRRKLRDLPL
ncbi:AMP-binding protein [Corynebacterium sp. Marseille-P4321]|uniref:AMP-binding protein n=1 Tax=Corynebacterium sp. Marseille-P4321 TaxID=2736603 RepID=UPI00158BE51F|nr:AMP-binding protein [Corynebacterium sp. Marseille-P4321]